MESKIQNSKLLLEKLLSEIGAKRRPEFPSNGWIRTVRESLGLSTTQTAKRLGVSQPRIIALERGEIKGSLTLQTLKKVARALDCTLVYALVPNQRFENTAPALSEDVNKK